MNIVGSEVPPPPAPPLAPSADAKLVAFIYILARDELPAGQLDRAVAYAMRQRPDLMTNPELRALADRLARTLTFTPSGMLPASISDPQESQHHVSQ